MPDRIKVEVKAEKSTIEIGESAEFEIQSNYLFGPPAKGLRLEPQCAFSEIGIETKTWGSFSFAQVSDPSYQRISSAEDLGETKLDDQGHASASCTLEVERTPERPVRVTMYATVSESGGRAVTGGASATLH